MSYESQKLKNSLLIWRQIRFLDCLSTDSGLRFNYFNFVLDSPVLLFWFNLSKELKYGRFLKNNKIYNKMKQYEDFENSYLPLFRTSRIPIFWRCKSLQNHTVQTLHSHIYHICWLLPFFTNNIMGMMEWMN